MDPRVAELVLRKCFGCREAESLLVVNDPSFEAPALLFFEAARRIGADAVRITLSPTGEEAAISGLLRDALTLCRAALILGATRRSDHAALRALAKEQGIRVLEISETPEDRLSTLLDVDYDDLDARTGKVEACLRETRSIRLTSTEGTNLTFEVDPEEMKSRRGRALEPGNLAALPAGEVFLTPLPGTMEGILAVNGSLIPFGRMKEPMVLRFSDGRLVDVDDPRLRRLLERGGMGAYEPVRFGIGTNPRARVTGIEGEDPRALGALSLRLGSNGAPRTSLILVDTGVEANGRKIELDLPPEEEGLETGSGLATLGTNEIFKALFEHSNDAQYILDIETQRFVEFNKAFEQLTGYSRREIIEQQITAQKLVARESMSTYVLKRDSRRENASERYDLKILCKSGEKRPVEISVNRTQIGQREYVVGSMRDLTARKRLETEMWEKIEELGHANNRIFALTEKIRRVPEFVPALLNVTEEEELLEQAADLLCARDGLAYESVTFYLLHQDRLDPVFSSLATRKRRLRVNDDSRLARIFRGEQEPVLDHREAVLPLKGRDRNLGVLVVQFHPKEIEVLQGNVRALNGYTDLLQTVANMLGLLVENLHLYSQVQRQATVDGLTGVFNRRFFDTRLDKEFQRGRRYGRSLSLMMIDLDNFKEVNDTFGHRQGDQVLVEVGRMLTDHTRDVDVVCRYGGDEFVILMPETPYEGALTKAETLRRYVEEHDFVNVLNDGRSVGLTFSIGVTALSSIYEQPADFLQGCDAVLFEAKRSGRNRTVGAPPGEKPEEAPRS